MTIAIKTAGAWTLHVLSAPFGSSTKKDRHGDYFDIKTDFAFEHYGLPPAVYYHGFDDNGRQSHRPYYVGKTTKYWIDGQGLWYEVVLDPAKPYAKRVYDAALKGQAVTSPGTIEHLMRRSPDGHLDHWPILEVSVFETTNGKRPANPRAVALPAIKAIYEEAGLSLPDDIEAPEADPQGASARGNATSHNDNHLNLETTSMTEEELNALFEKRFAEREAAAKAAADAEAAVQKRIADEVEAKTAAIKADMEKQAAASRRLPFGGGNQAPVQAQFSDVAKYDNLNLADHSAMLSILDAATFAKRSRNGASDAAYKAFAIKAAEDQTVVGERARNAIKAANPTLDLRSIKANEINRADLTSYGAEWVSDAWSNQLWEKIRLDSQVIPNLPAVEVPQGADSITIPVDSASISFYKVAAAADLNSTTGRPDATVPASRKGTTNKILTVSKIGGRCVFDGELEEDSLIPWVAQVRADMEREGMEVVESAVIDGDSATGATTNINDIGNLSTQAATNYWLMIDGFRKLALVTNTANSRDGGTLALDDFLETVKLMGAAGINALDRSKVGMIIDPLTYYKALTLTQVSTRDLFSNPTIEGGQLTSLYGYQLITSANMNRLATNRLSNGSGKVDQTTPANNTKGSILSVRWDQWRFGYKRRWTMEVERFADSDANQIVMLSRVGLQYRDTEASAVSYNLTV